MWIIIIMKIYFNSYLRFGIIFNVDLFDQCFFSRQFQTIYLLIIINQRYEIIDFYV